jgi:hypothetical protein
MMPGKPGSIAQRRGSPVSVRLPPVPPGEQPRDANGVLVGLGAAVGEEEDVDVTGRERRQFGAQARARLGGHEGIGIGQLRGLILDGLDHPRIGVADVDAHQLRVEVDVALALRGPEIDALGPRNGNGIHVRLRRPFEEGVALGERHHLGTGHSGYLGLGAHTISFAGLGRFPRTVRLGRCAASVGLAASPLGSGRAR